MTYGDGLCDINISKLVKFHKKNKPIATITAVRPPARFGSIKIKKKANSYSPFFKFQFLKMEDSQVLLY